MKRSAFINLVVSVVGGLLFSLGLCMCLLPEWDAFQTGVICAAIGAVLLLVQAFGAWKRSGKKLTINWKLTGKVVFAIFAALVLGVGMSMILVWNLMLPGVAVGILGIVLLLCLIPMFLGLK